MKMIILLLKESQQPKRLKSMRPNAGAYSSEGLKESQQPKRLKSMRHIIGSVELVYVQSLNSLNG